MSLAPWVRVILTPQDPVEGEILKDFPLIDVLMQATLIGHAQLLHHTSRGRIAGQIGSVDAVQPEDLKPIPDYRLGRLRAVARIPVGFPNPIAQLGVTIVGIGLKTNGPQEYVVGAPHNSKIDECPLLELLLVGADPLLR